MSEETSTPTAIDAETSTPITIDAENSTPITIDAETSTPITIDAENSTLTTIDAENSTLTTIDAETSTPITTDTETLISTTTDAVASTPTTIDVGTSIPTATPIIDEGAIFLEIYDCAKNRQYWNKVSSAISNHPDWLTRIPQGRRWTILHQIVYWGNISHLNEALEYQITNENFRFLFKALDDKTVREVAIERGHIHPQMLQRVERLVASDQLLSNARDGKWELVKQFLRQQPEIVNEKPPYKKYYLAHILALTGQLDLFKELSEICHFKLTLIADNKTVSQTARENHHTEFADYIETVIATATETETDETNNDDESTSMDDEDLPHVSPGFYDNPGIILFPLNSNSIATILSSPDDPGPYPDTHTFLQNLTLATHSLLQHHNTNISPMFATHSSLHSHNLTTMPTNGTILQDAIEDDETEEESKPESKPKTTPKMTEEELAIYEKNIMENIKNFPSEIILGTITCSITKGIFRDPVMAADGFTYEREAIENWLQKSYRSPMTNQELANGDLTPNRSIKSLLQQLSISKHEENSSSMMVESDTA